MNLSALSIVKEQTAPQQNGLGGCCIAVAVGITMFALFIIGCVAAQGGMTAAGAGGAIVGLSTPLIFYHIWSCVNGDSNFSKGFYFYLIIASVIAIVIGIVALAGGAAASAAGWGIVGPMLLLIPFTSLLCATDRSGGSNFLNSIWSGI